jgi:hypothetical protein
VRKPDIDAGVAYLLFFVALIVVFMIWAYNLPP